VKQISAKVVSVHSGSNDDLSKEQHSSIQVELDGIVGDRHRSYSRKTWSGDKQPKGILRRNERQWSAVSVEELVDIQENMDLQEPLSAASLGANLCLKGLPELSRLAKGTLLKFPSGAELGRNKTLFQVDQGQEAFYFSSLGHYRKMSNRIDLHQFNSLTDRCICRYGNRVGNHQ
jgi:hypothetical protein